MYLWERQEERLDGTQYDECCGTSLGEAQNTSQWESGQPIL